MQHVNCPACGAPVNFKSHASVTSVCDYCKTTVLKQGDEVRDLGRVGQVLEDYSPIQIGTSGRFQGQSFTVIGRLQVRYDDGFWNEWFLMFDSGKPGWLAEASGEYFVSFEDGKLDQGPKFEELRPGWQIGVNGKRWTVSDLRQARATGAEGELPIKVGQGYEARVADLRATSHFMTLDYSDPGPPTIYVGQTVKLSGLQCQLLRDKDSILESAGKLKGKVAALECPNCGSSIKHVPGQAGQLICPSCQTVIDASGPKAEAIGQSHKQLDDALALTIGTEVRLQGKVWTVIGGLRRAPVGDPTETWDEFLLHHPSDGLSWLVFYDGEWSRAEALPIWPDPWGDDKAVLMGANWSYADSYQAKVVMAIGAFNWRVKVGDLVDIVEYNHGKERLSRESTAQEMTWSRVTTLPPEQVARMFAADQGQKLANAAAKAGTRKAAAQAATSPMAKFWTVLGILNVIPLFMSPGRVLLILIFAGVLVWIPYKMFNAGDPD